jgi:hypothetical protein
MYAEPAGVKRGRGDAGSARSCVGQRRIDERERRRANAASNIVSREKAPLNSGEPRTRRQTV